MIVLRNSFESIFLKLSKRWWNRGFRLFRQWIIYSFSIYWLYIGFILNWSCERISTIIWLRNILRIVSRFYRSLLIFIIILIILIIGSKTTTIRCWVRLRNYIVIDLGVSVKVIFLIKIIIFVSHIIILKTTIILFV